MEGGKDRGMEGEWREAGLIPGGHAIANEETGSSDLGSFFHLFYF